MDQLLTISNKDSPDKTFFSQKYTGAAEQQTSLEYFVSLNRSLCWCCVVLLFLFIMVHRVMPCKASDAVTIGAIFSQSGIAASHNEPLITMVQLAVEAINSAGGIAGLPVKLVLLDNQSTPIGATIAAEEAVRLGVTAVIGAHWSSHSLAMAPLLQNAGIPMISPGSTNPNVTKAGDYIFRACFLDSFQGKAMARFAYQDLQAKTAVILRNIDEEYSVMLAGYFRESFVNMGGKVLLEAEYRGKAVDFVDIIPAIKRLNPEVIYLPGYTRDSGLFVRQARNMGVSSVFLGGDAWDEIETVAGETIDGSYQSAPWHPDVPFPKSKHLQKLFSQKFGKPIGSISAPLAYDAVYLLADAIKRAGSIDRKKIRDAIGSTTNFHGATGVISFDKNGDPENKEVIIIRFGNGERIYQKAIKY